MKLLLYITLPTILFAFYSCKKGEVAEVKQYSKLKVTVTNQYKQPVSGFTISLKTGSRSISKVSESDIYTASYEAGGYTLTINKTGFIDFTEKIQLNADELKEMQIVLKAGEAYLKLNSDSILRLPSSSLSSIVKIQSNTKWITKDTSDWIEISKAEAFGDDEFYVQTKANLSDSIRSSTIKILAGDHEQQVVITQYPPIRIKKTIGIPGNVMTQTPSSIKIEFNQPVILNNLQSLYYYCISGTPLQPVVDSNILSFNYSCGELGGEYPFSISVKNTIGDTFAETINVGFYLQQLHFKGNIVTHFVNDKDNSFWLLMENPDILYKIDMRSLKIIKEYPLFTNARMITVNPYNDKIYIGYSGVAALYILNPDFTYKTIPIKLDSTRLKYNQYEELTPELYPVNLVFTKSGIGLLSLSYNGDVGNSRFWFIDAAHGHKTWYTNAEEMEWYPYTMDVNYDQSKIIFTNYSLQYFTVFDSKTMAFNKVYSKNTWNQGDITVASRKDANVYFQQVYYQSVVNIETGSNTNATLDALDAARFDFDYGQKNKIVGFRSWNGYVEVLDFTNSQTPIAYHYYRFFNSITNTLDGKYIITAAENGNGDSWVSQFPGEWFREEATQSSGNTLLKIKQYPSLIRKSQWR
ncbi:hypothetical protein A8C56_07880 [Niabella ginsenosidivorans]|uniref:BACON domain-containing protein n=1 Tax=Niabella ginsenosidivorans TaxID=1176587 RepID=A0A1A9I2H4_9BACT|nr:BACON domain-containing protein [Niabella ginsenosidivorans]ANH80910.1 hypothetical protein A8C56_07880 [Niabella ginsenosidivorans]